ncbi:MAG TPA: 2-dehydropantoate 2-reductase [Geminicoccaceae bacterium]
MRIAIVGAGAIGGYLAVQLAHAGEEVVVLARDQTLEALRARGFTLRIGGQEQTARVRASDDAAELGPVDYVIMTLKANAAPIVTPKLPPFFGPGTAVVTAMNGLPFWYFHGLEGPWQGRHLESVDPGGVMMRTIGPERCIGCAVYPAARVVEPAVIEHEEGDRFSLGEPDGSRSERVQRLSRAMIAAGLKAPVRPRIRDEIWVKLWGNLSFNPISALTGATLDVICDDPGTRAVARAMMLEAQAVAEKLGVRFPIDVDKRIDGARAVGAHKTSMLQDLERARALELDALVTVVQELGSMVDVRTPVIDAVAALTRLRAEVAGCPTG